MCRVVARITRQGRGMRGASVRDGIAISERAVREGSPQVTLELVGESPMGVWGRASQAGEEPVQRPWGELFSLGLEKGQGGQTTAAG